MCFGRESQKELGYGIFHVKPSKLLKKLLSVSFNTEWCDGILQCPKEVYKNVQLYVPHRNSRVILISVQGTVVLWSYIICNFTIRHASQCEPLYTIFSPIEEAQGAFSTYSGTYGSHIKGHSVGPLVHCYINSNYHYRRRSVAKQGGYVLGSVCLAVHQRSHASTVWHTTNTITSLRWLSVCL